MSVRVFKVHSPKRGGRSRGALDVNKRVFMSNQFMVLEDKDKGYIGQESIIEKQNDVEPITSE